MKRNKSTWFAVALLGGSIAFQPLAYADDFSGRAAAEMDKMFNQRLDQIKRSDDPPDVKATKIRQLADEYNQAMGTGTSGGLAGNLNRTRDAIGSGTNTQPRQPGFWDKAGDKALDIIAELLKQAISNWMNKPTEENLRKIEALERERDRLNRERNNPVAENPANGFGRPVYDSNGNVIGWDRDGDGRPDSTDTNGDGRPDNFNGGSNDNGYADPYEYLDGGAAGGTGGGSSLASGSRPIYDSNGTLMGFDTDGDGRVDLAASNPSGSGAGDSAGGGASTGGSGGAGLSGGGAAAGGVAEGKEGEDKEKEDKEKEELATAEGKDGVKTGKDGKTADGKRDRNGDGVDDDRQLEVVMGRIIVLPKVDPLDPGATPPTPGVRPADGGAASVRPGANQPGGPAAAPTKPLEDDWNDAEDNGDKGPDDWGEEWGDEWGDGSSGGAGAGAGAPGKPAKPGQPGQPGATRARPNKETEIVDQLIRVETVIAEWRKQAKEEAQGARDPYAFHDGAGMQGADGKTEDPLAEYRLPDGKVDLTRVDIWIVERDSWKEGQEPRRFQVTVDEAAIDQFEPMPGHYVMCRGVMSKVDTLDPRVLDEIKGAVKKLDLVQVVLQSETPPEEGMNGEMTPGAPGTKPGGTKPNPGGGAPPTDEDW